MIAGHRSRSCSPPDPEKGLLCRGSLGLHLHEDQLEWLVAHVLGEVLAGRRPHRRARLDGRVLGLSVRKRELDLTIGQEHGYGTWMLVHHGLLVRPIRNAEYADLVVLELHLVM